MLYVNAFRCLFVLICININLSDARRFISELGWDGFLRPCPVGVGAASVTLRASYCPWGQLGNWWKHMETWSSILVKKMFHHTSLGHLVSNFTDARKSLSGPPSDMYFRWKIHHRPPPSVAYRTCTSSVEKEKDPHVHWTCQFALKRVEIWYICIYNHI